MIKILYPHPALLLKEENKKHIIISDLHIGFEERFVKKGISIETSTEKMKRLLIKLIQQYQPEDVIILGDVKDSISRITNSERRELPKFFDDISTYSQVRIIPGNHDGGLKSVLAQKVILESVYGITIEKSGLLHGHTKPKQDFVNLDRIIMGHLHPIFNQPSSPISGSQIWAILKVEKKYLFESSKGIMEIIAIPSFNTELTTTGFSNYRKKEISPILRRIRSHVNDAIFMTLEGDIIGGLNHVTRLI